jgi:hypothetical protein
VHLPAWTPDRHARQVVSSNRHTWTCQCTTPCPLTVTLFVFDPWPPPTTPFNPPPPSGCSPLLDKSLTTLLTSLLGTLADATAFDTTTSSNKAPNAPSQTSNSLVQLLTHWADEFLVSNGVPSASPGSNPAEPASVAKTLFMQLLAELLPPAEGTTALGADSVKGKQGAAAAGKVPESGLPSVGRGLLAATAAAFTAREAANRLQACVQGEGVSAGGKVQNAAEPSSGTGRLAYEEPAVRLFLFLSTRGAHPSPAGHTQWGPEAKPHRQRTPYTPYITGGAQHLDQTRMGLEPTHPLRVLQHLGHAQAMLGW